MIFVSYHSMSQQLPILILSTPRTGSTVLGEYLKLKYNISQFFIEPDYVKHANAGEMTRLNDLFRTSKKFILKFHYFRIHLYDKEIIDYMLYNAYKIRIRRKDFVKQVTSFYIAQSRGDKWHFRNNIQLNDTIIIDTDKINDAIRFLKETNEKLDRCDIKFDEDIWYEDLPNVSMTSFRRTPEPINYNEIVETVKNILNKK